MIGSIATLLGFQLLGEVLSRVLRVPVPGPVVGMVLLFLVLRLRGTTPRALGEVCRTLLSCLSLLFVPAGVGIITHLGLVTREWLPIAVTLVASTAATMVVTAFALRWLMRRTEAG